MSDISQTTLPDLARLERAGISILKKWIADDPANERAAGDYYLNRLAQDKLLLESDCAIVRYLASGAVAAAAHIFEMGTGFGELGLLLAATGFRVTAFESHIGRHSGALVLKSGLERFGIPCSDQSVVCGLFPSKLNLDWLNESAEAVFVSTNVTSSYIVEHFDFVLRSLRLFDHIIIDIARFGADGDRKLQRGLTSALIASGYVSVAVIHQADGCDIRHFRRNCLNAHADAQVEFETPAITPEKWSVGLERLKDDNANKLSVASDTSLQWIARLEQLLVPMLQHQIEKRGIEETGAYDFYKARIAQGKLLQDYEIAVARELRVQLPSVTRIDEVGSGFGSLVFLLGWSGVQALGFEADNRRAKMAWMLREHLAVVDPELTSNIALAHEEFPANEVPPPAAGSLVLSTNLVATRTDAQQAHIVEAMRRYTYALVDIQRLFVMRRTEADQEAGLALFRNAGFSAPQHFLDLGQNGLYYLFSNTRPLLS